MWSFTSTFAPISTRTSWLCVKWVTLAVIHFSTTRSGNPCGCPPLAPAALAAARPERICHLTFMRLLTPPDVIMCFFPKRINGGQYVACRHCIDCRLNKAREWSFRVAAEASLYDRNCMVTLTYSDEFLSPDKKVDRRAVQLFMKRLRKAISPAKVRFFACGEYGARFDRPHYHIVLFGFQPDDLVDLRRDRKGTLLYRSALIERLWTFGFSSVVTDVNLYVSRYVAKYMQKDKQGFITMSRRPALGFDAFSDVLLRTDKLYVGGAFTRLPRTFIDKSEDRLAVDLLKQRRRDRLSEFHTLDDHGYPVFSPDLYEKWVADRRDRFFDRFPEFR